MNFKKCIYEISYYFTIFHTFTLRIHVCVHVGINNLYIYIYIYIFVLFGLKQVVSEACNNTKNCKMIMMSSFNLIQILNEEEQCCNLSLGFATKARVRAKREAHESHLLLLGV
jgi:hypothetical protein